MDMPNIVSSEVHYGFAVVGIGTILGHHVLWSPIDLLSPSLYGCMVFMGIL